MWPGNRFMGQLNWLQQTSLPHSLWDSSTPQTEAISTMSRSLPLLTRSSATGQVLPCPCPTWVLHITLPSMPALFVGTSCACVHHHSATP